MLVNEFYIIKRGKKRGPVNFQELSEANLEGSDLVFYEGLEDYTFLHMLPDLKEAIIQKTPFEVPDAIEDYEQENGDMYVDLFLDVFSSGHNVNQESSSEVKEDISEDDDYDLSRYLIEEESERNSYFDETIESRRSEFGCLNTIWVFIKIIIAVLVIHWLVENMAKGILTNEPIP